MGKEFEKISDTQFKVTETKPVETILDTVSLKKNREIYMNRIEEERAKYQALIDDIDELLAAAQDIGVATAADAT